MKDNNYLQKAIEIKNWIQNNENKLPPSKKSEDNVEKGLAKDLLFIRKKLIAPYQKLKKAKAIKSFEEKHPDIYEIVNVIQEIDKIEITKNFDGEEQRIINQNKEIEKEIEDTIEEEQEDEVFNPEFEYDEHDVKQTNLVKLILKDLKLTKKIEKANKLKQKYKKEK